MQPADSLPVVKPLHAGWGPVIFFQGKYYPGRVLECEQPIEPGHNGEALIGLMATAPDSIGVHVGSTFELRDGPKTLVATATVLDYTEV